MSRVPSRISIAMVSAVSMSGVDTMAAIMAGVAVVEAVAALAADAAAIAGLGAADRGGSCFDSRGNQRLEREGGVLSLF